jgi:glycosyltransferase involved in cell wall biosynthesis
MENMPLVSIITPLYNSERFIKETIMSVLTQTYTNWEMIIVDDSSTDNSVDIVKNLIAGDPRIKLIRLSKNSGADVARNTAIEAAQGKYVAFLDSDDLWHPEKLEKQIRFMEDNDYLLTYTYYEQMDTDGNYLGKIVTPPERVSYNDMLKSNYIGCLTAVYNQDKLGKKYMPSIKSRQDYGLWLKILKEVPYAYCLSESLAYYRIVSGSVSSNKIKMLKYNWNLFYNIENLSLFKSLYYLGWNIYKKVFK